MVVKRKVKNKFNSSYVLTTESLYSYPALKKVSENKQLNSKSVNEAIEKIEHALNEIVNDPYFRIIPMYYFEGKTIAAIAIDLNISNSSVSRYKYRLLNKLKVFMYAEKVAQELSKN